MSDPLFGGLRERMITESVHLLVRGSLDALGWLTPQPKKRRDVHYMERPAADKEPIELNTVGVFSEHIPARDDPLEMGNTAQYKHWQWYADVYAQDEALGGHLAGDIRALLQGRLPEVGATQPTLYVYDFTIATPPVIFTCDIENVGQDRAPTYAHPWQQYWFSVPFTIVDVA